MNRFWLFSNSLGVFILDWVHLLLLELWLADRKEQMLIKLLYYFDPINVIPINSDVLLHNTATLSRLCHTAATYI